MGPHNAQNFSPHVIGTISAFVLELIREALKDHVNFSVISDEVRDWHAISVVIILAN